MTPRQFSEIRSFIRHTHAVFTSKQAARDWLDMPSEYLYGSTPREVVAKGDVDQAHHALFALDSGVYV